MTPQISPCIALCIDSTSRVIGRCRVFLSSTREDGMGWCPCDLTSPSVPWGVLGEVS
jgi:hypothetical protein